MWNIFGKKEKTEEDLIYEREYVEAKKKEIPNIARRRALQDVKSYRGNVGSGFKEAVSVLGQNIMKSYKDIPKFSGSGFLPQQKKIYKRVKVPIKKKKTYSYKKVLVKPKQQRMSYFSIKY